MARHCRAVGYTTSENLRFSKRQTKLEEYYLTRAETPILQKWQVDIAASVGSDAILVEYGAGAGIKTELVLGALRHPRGYVPIDIAEALLQNR